MKTYPIMRCKDGIVPLVKSGSVVKCEQEIHHSYRAISPKNHDTSKVMPF